MENVVNSPTLAVDPGIVKSPTEFVQGLTMDLTDSEAQQALKIILPITRKWQDRFRSSLRHQDFTVDGAMKMVDEFEDELVYELATKMDLIATVDVSPVFEAGQPPIVDLVGCLGSHGSAKHGFDHEKEGWEVRKSKEQGEDFLGASKLT